MIFNYISQRYLGIKGTISFFHKYRIDESGNWNAIIYLFVILAIISIYLSATYGGNCFFYFIGFLVLIVIIGFFNDYEKQKKIKEQKIKEEKEENQRRKRVELDAIEEEKGKKAAFEEIENNRRKRAELEAIQSEKRKQDELEAVEVRGKQAELEEEMENERINYIIFNKNKDLLDKFLNICERKVSVLDDYGDENWDALTKEVDIFLNKLAGREEDLEFDFKRFKGKKYYCFERILGKDYDWWSEKLTSIFLDYHAKFKTEQHPSIEFNDISGTQFEIWISEKLKKDGFDVSGTPAIGDQGADLIARKGDRQIIIQAKRHKGAVGNKSVQEVIGALQFYNGTEGWVITNSTFTKSAKELAQKAKIKLIDGKMLEKFDSF